MRPSISSALRPAAQRTRLDLRSPSSRITRRDYSNAGAAPKRRAVTPFNDTGHVPWTELSAAEKTGRAAQQTFNYGLALAGLALTSTVGYFLYTDLFATDSKVAYFNRAVDRIKLDPRCLELLGDSKKITAFGEETNNKWRRARPIASTTTKDARGNEHMMIHFNIQGPKGTGLVNMHLIKPANHSEFEYKYFYVDVRGHQRIYLENADAASTKDSSSKGPFKLFGVSWG